MTRIRYAATAALLGAVLVAPPHDAAAPVPATPAVDVAGRPSTADRIAVLVPGVGTTPANLAATTGVMARTLYDSAAPRTRPGGVAVVAWLGYRPPDGLGLEAARSSSARAGAPALGRYVAALVAGRPEVRVTLVGHSYGALVIGYAAPTLPPQVTDIVTLGAPGMGADRVADLHTTARVWAAESPHDWIRFVPGVRLLDLGLGRHPADPSFGANRLPVAGVDGHPDYLTRGTATLTAVAGIVAVDS
ncbi:alpha/beta hydrolase [Phytohabitans sp. ZYX-F-186]|uniref:Alpha/beta hydrolase n=1 Tax=Phytohabitans maris TaxID=3071409 RepID=A0ABU0ZB53_9ACTN|nr:alpha/beta hydrolase [Phytohabitans sp. ZYX-F-186]MDQ7904293.1 alpha/beta hydrolase [Phytohabitans sp. ZYX-F-186]